MKKQSHIASILLGLIVASLIASNQLGWDLLFTGNDRATLIAVGVFGMLACGQGIGRIAEGKRWLHPITLLGMLIGAATLIVFVGRLFNFALPFAESDSQAILTLGVLMGAKLLLARLYGLLRAGMKPSEQTA